MEKELVKDFTLRLSVIVISGFIAVLAMPIFVCTCGHLSYDALWINLTVSTLGSYQLFKIYQKHNLKRVFIGVVPFVFQLVITLKNIGDVLWFGHNPLL